MFIPDPDFYPSRIPDTGSRIPDPKTVTKERGEKKCYHTFFVVTNFTKLDIMLFLRFLPKNFSICSQIGTVYGFRILDPGSGKTIIRIPDPGSRVLKVNGSGSTTLILSYCFSGHRNEGGGHSCLTREDAG